MCIGVIIETKAAVDDAEEILSAPDFDFAFMGPNDLSVQYGVPGERNNPDVTEAIERAESLAKDNSVALGAAGHDPDKALELLDDGYQVVRLLDEFDAIRTIFEERWNAVSEQVETENYLNLR